MFKKIMLIFLVGFGVNDATAKMIFGAKSDSFIEVTVKQAKALQDDTRVKLKGYITSAKGNETYCFKDKTGEITVYIDDDVWKGFSATDKTQVLIRGEIEHETGGVHIDVSAIEAVKKVKSATDSEEGNMNAFIAHRMFDVQQFCMCLLNGKWKPRITI